MAKRWTEKDLHRAEERIAGNGNIVIQDVKCSKIVVNPTYDFTMEQDLFAGKWLSGEQLKEMGFVPLPLRAMGAVRTTKYISVMPLERLSGKNRNAKLRWMEYCEYKDEVRRYAKPASVVSGVDVVAWFKVTESWSKKEKAAKVWTRMEQKPDTDNIIKGVMDACMVKDEMVSLTFGVKWWSDMDVLWIRWRYK